MHSHHRARRAHIATPVLALDCAGVATLRDAAVEPAGLSQPAHGSLSVSRWNLSWPLADLNAADQFLVQIGGAA